MEMRDLDAENHFDQKKTASPLCAPKKNKGTSGLGQFIYRKSKIAVGSTEMKGNETLSETAVAVP